MTEQNDNRTDQQKFTEVIQEIGVPFEVDEDGEHVDITLNASASDKYVTLTFKHGAYLYGN